MDSLYDKASKATEMFEMCRTIMRHKPRGVGQLIRFLEKQRCSNQARAGILLRELNYFKSNRHRCDYQRRKKQNISIGSGIVESTCKTLITQRMKCSGMAWRWKAVKPFLILERLRIVSYSMSFGLR